MNISDLITLKKDLERTKVAHLSNDGLRKYLKLSLILNKYNHNKKYKNLYIDKVYRKLCKVDEFENFMDLFQQTTYITEYWINYDYILELEIEYMFTSEELEALKNDKIDYIAITLDY